VAEPIAMRLVVGGLMLACGWVVGLHRFRLRQQAVRGGFSEGSAAQATPPLGSPLSRFLTVAARVSGSLLAAITMLYVLSPTAVRWGEVSIPGWIRWCGLVPAAVGLGLLRASLAHLGASFTDTAQVPQAGRLVTDGPYRTIRHPYYAAAALLMIATSLLTANLLVAVAASFVWGLLWCRLPEEERALEAAYGDQYRSYAARTGRFFPRLGR
jgi:protein-S-isoprenylcysteine O-methyltransferase Ste14